MWCSPKPIGPTSTNGAWARRSRLRAQPAQHHRIPSTGELVPLLHIAAAKTDAKRLLLVSQELANVLSSSATRLPGAARAIPSCRPTTSLSGSGSHRCACC